MIVLEGPPADWPRPERRTALTIGVYDGVHLGHRHVIARLVERAGAEDLLVTVVTFRQHPVTLLAPDRVPPQLTTLDHRIALFESAGVDVVAVLDFDDDLRRSSPEAFVEEILVDRLRPAVVAVGDDFRFGYQQAGDIETLAALGATHGFDVVPVSLLGGVDGRTLSATAARTALAEGDLDLVTAILGRPFELCGAVVEGDRRGREIGFPTANLDLPPHQALPRRGVYAVRATVQGSPPAIRHPAVVNVGLRPTFGGVTEVFEVHLLDTDIDLYGQMLCVELVARIRDEQRFNGVDELVAQIDRDVEESRRLLDG